MSFEKSRGHRGSVNFPPNLKAFNKDAVPQSAREARRSVLDAKKMDILGLHKPGWNPSSYTGSRFPEHGERHTLAAFDSVKRSDYNYRSEWLDTRSTERYIPRANKFQISAAEFLSEEHRAHPSLKRPPKQTIMEMPVHPRLAGKTPWQVSVEALTQREREQLTQLDLERARARAPRSLAADREGLVAREARRLEEQRAEKRRVAALRAQGIEPEKTVESWYHITKEDITEMALQVPTKKVTTWSLGSI